MISTFPVPLELCRREGAAHLDDIVQRVSADNATLKPRVLQLEADHRALAQKLAAAHENARFTDHRFADLEVQRVSSIDLTRRAPSETP